MGSGSFCLRWRWGGRALALFLGPRYCYPRSFPQLPPARIRDARHRRGNTPCRPVFPDALNCGRRQSVKTKIHAQRDSASTPYTLHVLRLLNPSSVSSHEATQRGDLV